MAMPETIPPLFDAPYAEDDTAIARSLLATPALPLDREHRIDTLARALIGAIRAQSLGFGSVEALLREYALSTKEGIVLLALAESILRIPDAATADRLIEEKLAEADFAHRLVQSHSWLATAASWALGVTAQIVQPGDTPETIVEQLVRRLGMPAIRAATRGAVRLLGSHFVFAQTIDRALHRAQSEIRTARTLFRQHARRGRSDHGRRVALFRCLCRSAYRHWRDRR